MVRLVRLTLPVDVGRDVWTLMQSSEHIHGQTFVEGMGKDGSRVAIVEFKSVEKHLGSILDLLAPAHGLHAGGSGSMDIMALTTTTPSLKKITGGRKKRKYNMSDRQTIAEIEETIDSGAHLTFDYVAMTFVAAMISAVGLCTDSAVSVVASMLVSPLMGPILAFTYGVQVSKPQFSKLGLRNGSYGVLICILVGAVIGLLGALIFYAPLGIEKAWIIAEKLTGKAKLDSVEVNSRGEPWALFVGFFVAVPSGVGVALAITNTNINALVGVAISAALLPPVVNSGLCLAMGIVYSISSDPLIHDDGMLFLKRGLISFALFFLNIAVIFVCSIITFRIKNVVGNRDDTPSSPQRSNRAIDGSIGFTVNPDDERSQARLIPSKPADTRLAVNSGKSIETGISLKERAGAWKK